RSHPGVVAQCLDAVRLLPAEFRLGAAEMTVGRRLLVDGPAEVQVLDDPGGSEVEVAANHLLEPGVGDLARPERLDHDRDRVGHADGVATWTMARSASPAATTFLATWRAM